MCPSQGLAILQSYDAKASTTLPGAFFNAAHKKSPPERAIENQCD
tara:strand:- start:336 stop:470 length:135 start_codon:yes stop_codon:yes gene_type:complete